MYQRKPLLACAVALAAISITVAMQNRLRTRPPPPHRPMRTPATFFKKS